MRKFISLLIVLITSITFAQNEFHVYPMSNSVIVGTPNGDGSLANPWDLQTALSQSSDRVNGGDMIWIHKGVYNGRFSSSLQSNMTDKFITVSAFMNDKVVLNGNVESKVNYVLQVNGGNVIFKNFELTYLGDFSRSKSDKNFKAGVGISHLKGEDCKFQNLIIHNIPGSGIGSWKATAGTVIEDCVIYNNGYQGKRGHGVGIYVQNQSDKIRLIRNNIIFNNYYKGIEVWSATSGSNFEFVKNVTLTNNMIFNNGSPGGKYVDNLIIASQDLKGFNVAKHIKVLDNVLYHNVDFNDSKNYGYGSSLTLGYTSKAPVQDIVVQNNYIIGKNNALNISHAKSIVFKNNTTYAGYIHFSPTIMSALETKGLDMNNNSYYTRPLNGFRISKLRDYKLSEWQSVYKIDSKSELKQLKDFKTDPIIKVQKLTSHPNYYNVSILNKNEGDITVDFSVHNIKKGMTYKIYDIENRLVVVKFGEISDDLKITFPMGLKTLELPSHNTLAEKTVANFGVFRIEFEELKKESFFERLFGWMF